MKRIGSFFTAAERVFDYIPVVSTVTNGVELVTKFVLGLLGKYNPASYDSLAKKYSLIDRVSKKKAGECLKLMIPGVNILVAYQRDHQEKSSASIEISRARSEGAERAEKHKELMARRQETKSQSTPPPPMESMGLGARLKSWLWSGVESVSHEIDIASLKLTGGLSDAEIVTIFREKFSELKNLSDEQIMEIIRKEQEKK